VNREGAEVTAGRAFQTRAPATEKARRPTVGSLTAGTHRLSEVSDRSLCRDGMSVTDVNCRRYWGASPCSATFGERAFSSSRPSAWNALPTYIRDEACTTTLK